MKIILCSYNSEIVLEWESNLHSQFEEFLLCSKNKSLLDIIHELQSPSDYIIMYHMKSDPNDEKALYTLLQQHPIAHRILVLVNTPNTDQGIRLLHSGVHGYANARINAQKLLAAINVIIQGEIWAGEDILMKLLQKVPARSTHYRTDKNLNNNLSNREKQIIDQIIQGKTNKQIAEILHITERTVKAHLSAVFKKTQTRNRLELTVKLQSL